MNNNVVTVVAVSIAVPAALAVLKRLVESYVERDTGREKTDRTEYRISPYAYAAFTSNLVLGALSIMWGFQSDGPANAPILYKTFGAFFILFPIASFFWLSACRIELKDTGVVLCSPTGTREILFKNLKRVRVSNGMIVLDEGRIPRTVIPIIYKHSSEMLANIKARMEAAHSDF